METLQKQSMDDLILTDDIVLVVECKLSFTKKLAVLVFYWKAIHIPLLIKAPFLIIWIKQVGIYINIQFKAN